MPGGRGDRARPVWRRSRGSALPPTLAANDRALDQQVEPQRELHVDVDARQASAIAACSASGCCLALRRTGCFGRGIPRELTKAQPWKPWLANPLLRALSNIRHDAARVAPADRLLAATNHAIHRLGDAPQHRDHERFPLAVENALLEAHLHLGDLGRRQGCGSIPDGR